METSLLNTISSNVGSILGLMGGDLERKINQGRAFGAGYAKASVQGWNITNEEGKITWTDEELINGIINGGVTVEATYIGEDGKTYAADNSVTGPAVTEETLDSSLTKGGLTEDQIKVMGIEEKITKLAELYNDFLDLEINKAELEKIQEETRQRELGLKTSGEIIRADDYTYQEKTESLDAKIVSNDSATALYAQTSVQAEQSLMEGQQAALNATNGIQSKEAAAQIKAAQEQILVLKGLAVSYGETAEEIADLTSISSDYKDELKTGKKALEQGKTASDKYWTAQSDT